MRPRVDRHGVVIPGSWICAVCDGKVFLDWNPHRNGADPAYLTHVMSREHRDKVRSHLLDTQQLFDDYREEEVRLLPRDPRFRWVSMKLPLETSSSALSESTGMQHTGRHGEQRTHGHLCGSQHR